MRRRLADQLPLDCRQPPRPRRREKPIVYQAIVALRRQGMAVYRQGRSHSVDGAIASDAQLMELAGTLFVVGYET